ncbi:MAG TPA: hypothetical protein VLS86_04955, partial [Acidimicrobiia bacterium]|nr:hypothetical protein [Acidimicrobiia bacterium]
ALDVAVSHSTLSAVARGEIPAVFRLNVPGPVVAFGRADRVQPGYAQAVRAAAAHGFGAVERLAGGRRLSSTSRLCPSPGLSPKKSRGPASPSDSA